MYILLLDQHSHRVITIKDPCPHPQKRSQNRLVTLLLFLEDPPCPRESHFVQKPNLLCQAHFIICIYRGIIGWRPRKIAQYFKTIERGGKL